MRQFRFPLIITAIMMAASCVSRESYEESVSRIEENEKKIATVNEQIAAITGSISGLESVDEQLKSYINTLNATATDLEMAISVNARDIESLESLLSEKIDAAKLEQLEALKALDNDLKARLATINSTLVDLLTKDAELESKITSLKEYVDKELKGAKDWATATFSTIEQYNSTVAIIAEIKADIAAINKAIEDLEAKMSSKIDEAIAGLEQSIKTWVNSQLTAYYTIAQIDAKIALIETAIDESDDAAMAEIEALKTKLSEQKTEITEAYNKAISEAITTNNGVIDGKIQAAVDTINQRITDEIAAINLKITDIYNRLAGIEASIAEIMNMIQSITVIPTYSDGDVALGEGETSLYFEVLPLEAAKKLESVALTAFSLKAVSTIQTKANVEYKVLPISAVALEDDLVKVTTTGKDLSQDFFNGALSLNARLSISSGLSSVSTAFFGLKPQGEIEVISLRIAEFKKKIVNRIILNSDNNLILSFVDGSAIELPQHSVAPRLYLDYDGYWSASYNNGETISRIMNNNAEYINAGDLQVDELVSVRFIEDGNSNYAYQTYLSTAPEIATDEIGTLVPVDHENSVKSIVEDHVHHTITITTMDGASFTYKQARIMPTGISVLTNKIKLAKGSTVYVDFRVNASNASFNYDVSSPLCEISLDYIGDATKSTYVTTPNKYKLTRIEQVYDDIGFKKEGQYRASISDLGVETNYNDVVAFVLTINDGIGQRVQFSTSAIELVYSDALFSSFRFLKSNNESILGDVEASIEGNTIKIKTDKLYDLSSLIPSFTTSSEKVYVDGALQQSGISAHDFTQPVKYIVDNNEYTVYVEPSLLPFVIINTPNAVLPINKDDEINNSSFSIVSSERSILHHEDNFTLKGRGNTTWIAPKKPYAVKLNKKKSLLSLSQDKSWVLLANYYDPTLLRNSVVFYIGNCVSSLDWTPHYEQVDLILNGQYKGIYQFGEKVKISEGRVNVGNDGILMEVDAWATSEADSRYFSITHIEDVINIKDPDVEYGDDTFLFAQSYLTTADNVLFSDYFMDPEEGWQKYLDIDSFVEWYLIHEITKNADSNFHTSCYMNLTRGGKLKMGPLWDYDLSLGGYPEGNGLNVIVNNPEGFYIKNVAWYNRLFEDPVFVEKVKERFQVYFNNKQSIINYIDKQSSILSDKIYEENLLWGRVCNTSASEEEVLSSYNDKINYLKNWIENRFAWLNVNINSL